MIEPPLVVSITLLSLADDTGELFDRIDIALRRSPLDQVPVVAFAPAS